MQAFVSHMLQLASFEIPFDMQSTFGSLARHSYAESFVGIVGETS
jgi:hypothetical protein